MPDGPATAPAVVETTGPTAKATFGPGPSAEATRTDTIAPVYSMPFIALDELRKDLDAGVWNIVIRTKRNERNKEEERAEGVVEVKADGGGLQIGESIGKCKGGAKEREREQDYRCVGCKAGPLTGSLAGLLRAL